MLNSSLAKQPVSINRLLLVTLIVSFIIAYFPVIKKLILHWSNSDDYSHGFFIVPVCLYIIWSKKEILKTITINSSIYGLFLALFSLVLYLAAFYAEISTVASFSLVTLITGIVIYYFGFSMARELAFPIVLLIFMIPIPAQIYSYITLPLQLFVSTVSAGITSAIGIPIFRDGNILQIPEHTLQVVTACSGLRSMISLLVLSAIFGFFTLNSNKLRTILFLTGIPVAIFVNIIRILLMIMAFHYLNFDLTKESIHTIFGISIYFFGLISIFAIQKGMLRWDKFE